MPVRKKIQKVLRVSDFALLLVVFKIHHCSEGVKPVVFFVVVVVLVVAAAAVATTTTTIVA